MKRITWVSLALLCLGATVNSCTKVISTGGGSSDHQDLQLLLTDDPPGPGDLVNFTANITAINVDIRSVSVMMMSDTSHWDSLNIRSGVYNLINLKNGLDTALGTTSLKEGQVKAFRIVFGNDNSVTANGVTVQLGMQFASTFVVPVWSDSIVLGNSALQVWMDIDAGHSIAEVGQGNFSLKPFIRFFTSNSASVTGMVAPRSSAPVVGVIDGTDTLIALPTFPAGDTTGTAPGMWEVRGLKAGSVNVIVHATAPNFMDTAYLNVAVMNGQTTDLGTVWLKP